MLGITVGGWAACVSSRDVYMDFLFRIVLLIIAEVKWYVRSRGKTELCYKSRSL